MGFEIRRIPKFQKFPLMSLGLIHSHHDEFKLLRNSSHLGGVRFYERLSAQEYVISDRTCPSCFSTSRSEFFLRSDWGFQVSLCEGCLLFYFSRTFDSKSNDFFYISGDYSEVCMGGISDEEKFRLESDYMGEHFLEVFRTLGVSLIGARIHEIGCGSGGILQRFAEFGAEVSGSDIDSQVVKFGQSKGLPIVVSDVFRDELPKEAEHLILSNVLEHLYDPRGALENLAQKMSGSQKLIIDVPDATSIAAYGLYTSDFFHIGHMQYFSPSSLELIAVQSGFRTDCILRRPGAMTIVLSLKSSSPATHPRPYTEFAYAINQSNLRHFGVQKPLIIEKGISIRN
jgi:SAM-dependent methyltransferase